MIVPSGGLLYLGYEININFGIKSFMPALSSLSDNELIHLVSQDDQGAYAEIFERYNSLLYAHAYKRLNNKQEAQDLMQDVFTNLWLKRKTLNITTSLTGYLYSAVRNKFYDILSHKRVEDDYIVSIANFFKTGQSITDHLVREKELTAIIEREIQSLPPRMRLIFEMSRKNFMSHKEIADELGISEQTVTDQIKKALKILKPRLLPIIIFFFSANFPH